MTTKMGTGSSLPRVGEIKVKHHCLPGPPSEPSQRSNMKLTVEIFLLMQNVVIVAQMRAATLLPRHTREIPCSQKCHPLRAVRVQPCGTATQHCFSLSRGRVRLRLI